MPPKLNKPTVTKHEPLYGTDGPLYGSDGPLYGTDEPLYGSGDPVVVAARQRKARTLRRMKLDCKRLLGEKGELGGMALAVDVIERLETLEDVDLGEFFDFLAHELSPDPQAVLLAAQAYAAAPGVATLGALGQAAEPPRQELFRRLNRMPGGTSAVLRLRRLDRVAQLVVQRVEHVQWREVDGDLPDSARGTGGHGSTGGHAAGTRG